MYKYIFMYIDIYIHTYMKYIHTYVHTNIDAIMYVPDSTPSMRLISCMNLMSPLAPPMEEIISFILYITVLDIYLY
jgi:hypothetical protein